MIGIKANKRKANKEEAEKPFWISFSDLMTALMVLFLVAMVVALISVSTAGGARTEGIKACVADFEKLVIESEFEGVSIPE
jgi:flagellar motor protein MotB